MRRFPELEAVRRTGRAGPPNLRPAEPQSAEMAGLSWVRVAHPVGPETRAVVRAARRARRAARAARRAVAQGHRVAAEHPRAEPPAREEAQPAAGMADREP